MNRNLLLSLVGILLFSSCLQNKDLKESEGFINVKGGKIWYEIKGSANKTPIVLLHGGPGFPSYYLNPLLDLSNDRPVLIFDQLGCGRSDRITDTSLMTIENHIYQLHKILDTLNISEFYLYGHSWGTMLGMDYYFKYPKGIKGLILNSPCTDIGLWVRDADILISDLPDSIQFYLKESINNECSDSTKMKEAISVFYNTYYTRKQPKSEDAIKSEQEFGYNVYEYMWGKEDYLVTGTLIDYDRTNRLNEIKVPTIYITGEYDAARPSTVDYYHSLTPNSSFVILKNSGHTTMHDKPEENIEAIQSFLREIEKKK